MSQSVYMVGGSTDSGFTPLNLKGEKSVHTTKPSIVRRSLSICRIAMSILSTYEVTAGVNIILCRLKVVWSFKRTR